MAPEGKEPESAKTGWAALAEKLRGASALRRAHELLARAAAWLREDPRRSRWLGALGGTAVFAALGLALARYAAPHGALSVTTPERVPPLGEHRLERVSNAAGGDGAAGAGGAGEAAPDRPSATQLYADAFDCMIAPNEVVEIGSAITGRIEAIPVERSDYVEAGQVLAQLESTVEEAALRVAEARARREVELESSRVSLDLGRRRRARALELFQNDTLSLDAREAVETEVTLAALELERAQEDHRLAALELHQTQAALERRTIRSPISGYVVERLMAPGEVVDDETILRIAEIDPLRVEVILPSSHFGRVHPGDRAEIVPEPPLDQVRTAEVSIVDRIIDGASGTFGVRLLLPNPERDLPGGLRCQVRFLDADSGGTRAAQGQPAQADRPSDTEAGGELAQVTRDLSSGPAPERP